VAAAAVFLVLVDVHDPSAASKFGFAARTAKNARLSNGSLHDDKACFFLFEIYNEAFRTGRNSRQQQQSLPFCQ
jgi:hypothetical protein